MNAESPTDTGHDAATDTGRTPVVRDQHESSPALPGPVETAQQLPDIDPARDLGWGIALGGAIATLVCSWTLFGIEEDGMWAGYWAVLLCSISILGALTLRSTLPRLPGWATTAAGGAGLVLVGVVQGYGPAITIPLIAGGAIVVAGTAISASSRR
jgi:hypothetical protein